MVSYLAQFITTWYGEFLRPGTLKRIHLSLTILFLPLNYPFEYVKETTILLVKRIGHNPIHEENVDGCKRIE